MTTPATLRRIAAKLREIEDDMDTLAANTDDETQDLIAPLSQQAYVARDALTARADELDPPQFTPTLWQWARGKEVRAAR